MPKTSVCIITTVHPAFDTRIFHKQAKSLHEAGYAVSLITRYKKAETIDGISIIPTRAIKNRFARICFAPLYALALALKQNADVYHFHDPEFIPEALTLRLLGKKVIYDIHELVAEQIEDKQWLNPPALRKLARAAYCFMERLAVKNINHIILAEDGYMNYFSQTYPGLSNHTVIRNYPLNSFISCNLLQRKEEPFRAVYAGGLTETRGILEIIQAMNLLPEEYRLTLMGPWGSEEYKTVCMASPGWSRVDYKGNLPIADVRAEIQKAAVGLCMLYPIKNYVVSLPVKAFEYMGSGIPIIMSDFPLWEKIFSGCAVFANPYQPTAIAEKIKLLTTDDGLKTNLSAKGNSLVKEQYNWDKEKERLLTVYNTILEH